MNGDLGGRRRNWGACGFTSVILVCLVTLALLGAYWKVRSLWASINRVPVTDLGKRPRGFHITKTGGVPYHRVRTVIEYGAASQRPKANAVAEQFPGARLKQAARLSTGPVEVILGSRDSSLRAKPKPSPAHGGGTGRCG